MANIYLALGTNMGNRLANLRQAITALAPMVTVTATSSVYETAPVYVTNQPNFLNMVLAAQTTLTPDELLTYLKTLETTIGRQKTIRYGPRKIDLDILFYDQLMLETPILQIPHPRLTERAFVLAPLLEIAPDLQHPQLKKTMQTLYAALPTTDGIMHQMEIRFHF
ncbi:2-amino-4-hydroxy-6-hydroxymethyldihydropteridine diphosphokinase [Anaerolineales bacterium HSG25]|nr:2-amino-4-hydroxy-6-hydroxymethyldihydropteridine diphosphokinase [Anaerolineales bacterium HSG25]